MGRGCAGSFARVLPEVLLVRSGSSRLALVALVALAATGCVQPNNEPSGYGELTRSNFIDFCTGSALDRSVDGESAPEVVFPSEATCVCMYDHFEAEVSFDDFKTLENRAKDNPETVPADLRLAQDLCGSAPIAPVAADSDDSDEGDEG